MFLFPSAKTIGSRCGRSARKFAAAASVVAASVTLASGPAPGAAAQLRAVPPGAAGSPAHAGADTATIPPPGGASDSPPADAGTVPTAPPAPASSQARAAAGQARAVPPGAAGNGPTPARPTSSSRQLTLAAVLEQGLARSLELQRAVLAEQLARDDRQVLTHENDPHLNVGANWSDYRPRSSSSAPGAGGVAVVQRDQLYSAQLNATLYDFGRHASHLDQAAAAALVKNLATAELAQALRYRIARAYAAVVAAERVVQVAREEVAVESAKVRDQRVNYQRGLRPESDVVMAEVELGRAQLALTKAQDEATTARLSLGQLIGAESEPLLAGELPAASLQITAPGGWQQLLSSWSSFRPSPAERRRSEEIKALKADEEAVRAGKRPQLQAGLGATRSGGWGGDLRDFYSGQIALNWDLPWSHMERDELRRIGTRRQDLEVQEAIERKARSDLDAAARERFRAGQSQWQAMLTQQHLIERERELVRRRYQAGRASALEVSAAEVDLLRQRLDLVTLVSALAGSLLDVAEARAETAIEGVFQ